MNVELTGARAIDHDYPIGKSSHFIEGTCRAVDPQTIGVREVPSTTSGCGMASYCNVETVTSYRTRAALGRSEEVITGVSFNRRYSYDVVGNGSSNALFERYQTPEAGNKGRRIDNHWVEGGFDLYFMSIKIAGTARGFLYMIPQTPGNNGARIEYANPDIRVRKPNGTPAAVCELVSNDVGPAVAFGGMTLAAPTFPAGTPVVVNFTVPLVPSSDEEYWITLVPVGSAEQFEGAWHYVVRGADRDEIATTNSGAYEVRLHKARPGRPSHVIARLPVTIL